ncbi:MAG: magnesium transporter [Clostridiales bacterium]|jgi:magnesium transporter|uniref:magnesium transporter n=1 Tax=Bovifimicola ammoniilytica TaxID=2981720 RepID=UPI00033FB3D9|nr:magnesium transporter [Bovifimicola ammoniilytica]MBD8941063.1 magnesium transporter [Clostridiales bacterium]MCU6752474.1 magnesium transporter [Bovifimicola ammoniilytica]CCZ04630.1 magnesium transporter [Eubacterium sp. CAG:603]SCJ26073.1 Magnesium transporter mgtE [uncultured Eubacterium sp.]
MEEMRLEKKIEELLAEKKYSEIKEVFAQMNGADISALFEEVPENKIPLLFRLLPKVLAAETFVEMEADAQKMLIQGFSDNELKDVFNELYLDDAVDIVEEMPANVVKRILANTDPDTRKMINEVLKYPDDSAGSIMTIEYVSLRLNMTVEEAIKRIRRTGVDKETIYTCYVTDENRVLLGNISIKTLLLADENDVIKDIMDTNFISAHTLEDQETVANKFNKYDLLAIPVVDDENRLVGIITFDDAIDVMQDEATEDIKKMAAIIPSDKTYFKTTVFETWKARIPWLLLLMVSATFTGMIITSFEDALAAYTVLTAYIPMLMDTGGNSGGQASVTIIRALSLEEIEFSDIFRVIWKESRVAILCGLTLSICNFVKLLLFDRVTVQVALVVCITLAVTVLMAKIIGCTLPILAKKIGFDPAVMASPFITTIVDAISLIVYFRVASIFLGI